MKVLKPRLIYNGEEYCCQSFSDQRCVALELGFLPRAHGSKRKTAARHSFLLVDMKTPGITVRPIQSIDGSFGLNEVLLETVRVPLFHSRGNLRAAAAGICTVAGRCDVEVTAFLDTRASTIYGGAREVQKNIIAKLAFGL